MANVCAKFRCVYFKHHRFEIPNDQGYQRIDNETLYVNSRLYPWGEDNRRCYLHLYYNAYARAVAVDRFNEELVGYKGELESGDLVKEHSNAYDTFFVIKTTPKRGTPPRRR